LCIQVLPTIQRLYDFANGVVVVWPWYRSEDAQSGISGGTKVVWLVILMEVVMGW
jgi:hypothetical protein